MKISIIIPDETVYIGNDSVKIKMPDFVLAYRAIQWNEKGNNKGHIETESGENIFIDESGFAVYSDIVDEAILKIKNSKLGNNPSFKYTKTDIGEFDLYRVFAEKAGLTSIAGDQKDIQRNIGSIRVSMVTKGSRLYESVNNNFQPITMNIGDFNIDLPDMQANDSYKVTALVDETEYHCISKKDLTPFPYERFKLLSSETIVIPAGKNVFIGGGNTSMGNGPLLIQATTAERNLLANSDNVFGIVF